MSPRRTNIRRIPTAAPLYNAYLFLPTNKPGPQRGATRPYLAQLGAQSADARVENILSRIQAEYMNVLDIHHKTLDKLQRKEFEKAELERQMDYQSVYLQAAQQRAWCLEEQVSKLEVQLASREADPRGQD